MDQVDVVTLIISGALLVATAIAMAASIVQANAAITARRDAQSAQAASEAARDEASELARKATDAFVRQAEAQERANELTEAAQPKPHVRWAIGHDVGDMQTVVNTGDVAAYDVSLTGNNGFHIDDDSRSDMLIPGDSVTFAVMVGGGMDRPRLTIRWADEPGGDQRETSVAVSPMR
jgi:hypothetical protein